MNIVYKQYKYLYCQITDESVIRQAYKNMRKFKTKRREIKEIDSDLDHRVEYMKRMLENTKPEGVADHPEFAFHPPKHKPKVVEEFGKKRLIYIPSIEEQWVHHIIIFVLKPILLARFHEHSYGSIPERGIHKGKRQIERWMRRKRYRYCFKGDIRHFYASIRINLMIEKLEEFIKDDWLINLIKICFKWFEKGLPLGFYISQWFGNLFLEDLDKAIYLHGFNHIRYVDDIGIFGNNKRKLFMMVKKIKILLGILRLRLKNTWQIFRPRKHPIDFLGFTFYENRTVIRGRIVRNILRCVHKIQKCRTNNRPIWVKLARTLLSYMGWITYSDSYRFYFFNVKPFVRISALKKIVSKRDREEYKHDIMARNIIVGQAEAACA